MKTTVSIEDIFGTRGRVAVLRVLAGVSVPLSIRQVSAQAGLMHSSAAQALDGLVVLGVVSCTTAGRSRVHWLERRNLWVREVVIQAFASEEHMADGVIDELRAAIPQEVVSAVVFGSFARGEQTVDSDIDLMIVTDDGQTLDRVLDLLDASALDLEAVIGAHVSVVGYTLVEARSLVTRGDSVMDGVLREGVTLRGLAPVVWGTHDGNAKG